MEDGSLVALVALPLLTSWSAGHSRSRRINRRRAPAIDLEENEMHWKSLWLKEMGFEMKPVGSSTRNQEKIAERRE